VVLDCSNPDRLGWAGIRRIARTVVNVDHHRDNTLFGDINVVKKDASAVGQILYMFFTENTIDFPSHVAADLYTAILTDTGGFRFSNTNSTILSICADLAKRGADCSDIFERVYSSHSQSGLLLQARIWSTLSFHFDGRLCCMELPFSLIDTLGAAYSDSEGMADNTIIATGVEIGVFIKYSETETHFSLRSTGSIDVGKIAQKVPGGGGHCCAAGCTIYAPYEQAKESMFDIISQNLK
jgi:phosphoesterase RecJ-like protein